jgi:hypothetical protein
MPHRLLNRLTYANVVATLALFIALGGSSYAALKLPKNSVGSTQIKTGAVHSSEIANRTIGIGDISLKARASFRGRTGRQGAQGEPGAPAAKHFAVVDAGGVLIHGNAISGGSAGPIGSYVVGFSDSVAACAATATIGTAGASIAAAGNANTNIVSDRVVGVQTYNAAGVPTDLPFHLNVTC